MSSNTSVLFINLYSNALQKFSPPQLSRQRYSLFQVRSTTLFNLSSLLRHTTLEIFSYLFSLSSLLRGFSRLGRTTLPIRISTSQRELRTHSELLQKAFDISVTASPKKVHAFSAAVLTYLEKEKDVATGELY